MLADADYVLHDALISAQSLSWCGPQTQLEAVGKRGGYRYLHPYLEHRAHIHLLFLLDKGEQEDLSTEQRKALRRMVAELKRL